MYHEMHVGVMNLPRTHPLCESCHTSGETLPAYCPGLFFGGMICSSKIGFLSIRSNICWKLKINICLYLNDFKKTNCLTLWFQEENAFYQMLNGLAATSIEMHLSHILWIFRCHFDLSCFQCQLSPSESESIFCWQDWKQEIQSSLNLRQS